MFHESIKIMTLKNLCGQLKTNSKRPSWDEYFLNIAEIAATRTTCDRGHVGAVIVKDKAILSTGYNGAPRGDASL